MLPLPSPDPALLQLLPCNKDNPPKTPPLWHLSRLPPLLIPVNLTLHDVSHFW